MNAETGAYSLAESSEPEEGLLNKDTLFLSAAERGKTKDVYGVSNKIYSLVNV